MPNLGQIRRFLEPCDLEIWRMTLKNNRAPLLCCFQLCAWFHCHMRIQNGVRVRKRLSWLSTSVTLTFDLWPWPFAWTSLLTMVITPENFIMIRWWEHGEKGVTDRQTDRRTENTICHWSPTVPVSVWLPEPARGRGSKQKTLNDDCYHTTCRSAAIFGVQTVLSYLALILDLWIGLCPMKRSSGVWNFDDVSVTYRSRRAMFR